MRDEKQGLPVPGQLIRFIGLFFVTIVLLAACSGIDEPETSITTPAPALAQVTAEVKKGEDVLLISQDYQVYVYIPSVAIKGEGILMITAREADLFPEPEAQRTWYRGVVVNLDMFSHAGKLIESPTFLQPIDICFVLSRDDWKAYQEAPERFDVQYYQVDDSQWYSLELTTRPEARQICGQIDHLTLFALATQDHLTPETTPEGLYTP